MARNAERTGVVLFCLPLCFYRFSGVLFIKGSEVFCAAFMAPKVRSEASDRREGAPTSARLSSVGDAGGQVVVSSPHRRRALPGRARFLQ